MTRAAVSLSAFEAAGAVRKRAAEPSLLAIGYIRVSTEEQQLGPEAQERAIREYAARNGLTVVAIARDIGVSGAAPLDERPGLAEALDALSDAKASVVIVAKRDRLARDTMRTAFVERLVERAGARVVSADGIAGSSSPEDKLQRTILDAMAEYERALIRVRTKAALAAKSRRGEHVGQVPYGSVVQGSVLVPEPKEQAAIVYLVAKRDSGLSWADLAEAMNKSPHRPKKGDTWHPTSVRRIYLAAKAPR